MLKHKKKIMYVPEMIAATRDEQSTWFKGYDDAFFISRGAGYCAMSRLGSYILILQFALRKGYLYRENMSMFHAMSCMFKGRREYLKDKR